MQKLWKKMRAAWVAALLLTLSAGCSTAKPQSAPAAQDGKKLQVVASFYPLADFAKNVGKDLADVRNLVPPGVEPHDWEPKPNDMKTISQANVFIYNGAGFEPWIDKVLASVDQSKLVVVDASGGIDLLKSQEQDVHGQDEQKNEQKQDQHPDAHEHRHGEYDPHIWLDPVNAQKQVQQIAEAFAKADPQHKDQYEKNAKEYISQLQALDNEYKTELAKVKRKDIVTTHAAFGYLAHRYGLHQLPIMGLAPDAEPTPKAMAEIVKEAREHDVKYIFFETLVSPKVADTIAKEVGAQTLVLNPIEGLTEEELNKGENYISKMKENLQNLVKALGN
ncbi:metal ABC transporter substrate-binding protein [Effusibacillus pohliae]|uniref:metal ABC transporter substrate-binding protein n=1 Tax=Effusibacillus pohliae TaxID=232270 RepID=UPI000364C92E|nr:metal ABC transporter substrate-binding protein [Effusibacillus pohliae]